MRQSGKQVSMQVLNSVTLDREQNTRASEAGLEALKAMKLEQNNVTKKRPFLDLKTKKGRRTNGPGQFEDSSRSCCWSNQSIVGHTGGKKTLTVKSYHFEQFRTRSTSKNCIDLQTYRHPKQGNFNLFRRAPETTSETEGLRKFEGTW